MGAVTAKCLVKTRAFCQHVAMRFILLFILASPAFADDAMSAAEFDAYTRGKTLTFGIAENEAYGVEQYQENRRVIWSFVGGDCSNGVWYESKGSICFRYDHDPEPKCWKFYDEPNGLRAIFMNRPDTSVLYEAQNSDVPLSCPGPDLSS